MIAYLKGVLAFKSPAYVYVECHGVGYHVNISLQTYSALENLEEVKILTYMHTNDDGSTLYGFMNDAERSIFVHLISVSGIGPNTARVILSYMTTDEVKSAIIHENVAALHKIKGIGPKTAKRIILDLKDKMIKLHGDQPMVVSGRDSGLKDEALSAMVALGFPKNSVSKLLDKIIGEKGGNIDVEDLIKETLKQIK